FFFSSSRRHTIFSRDWSSDVCSSDLRGGAPAPAGGARAGAAGARGPVPRRGRAAVAAPVAPGHPRPVPRVRRAPLDLPPQGGRRSEERRGGEDAKYRTTAEA